MNYKYNYILIGLLTIIFTKSFSQSMDLNDNWKFDEAKITLLTYKKINTKYLVVKNDSIYFKNKMTKEYGQLSLDEVKYFKVRKDNYFGRGLFIGTATTTTISILSVAVLRRDKNPFTGDDAFEQLGKFIGSGALIGGLIGSFVTQWTTYYPNEQKNGIHKVQPDISMDLNGINCGIKLTF